ncbi:hypothetical protein ACFLQL_00770 [Verrucomicrobiota bacterium]
MANKIKGTSRITDVPALIEKLKETNKCGGTILGCYTIKIHEDCISELITDLEHTDKAATLYWDIRDRL